MATSDLPAVPKSGGSSNLYGVLYQLLGAAHRAATLVASIDPRDPQELGDALLIIEPAHGGGDLQLMGFDHRQVEQWKAKESQGTWSLRQIIEQVFPDLYLAVDETKLNENVVYRFVTEGRPGGWAEADAFFHALSKAEIPASPLHSLNATTQKKFFPDATDACSEKELFLQIASAVRKRVASSSESDEVTFRKLWHLLARFEMAPPLPIDVLNAKIDRILLGVVDFRENVSEKRRELCGLLLELVGKGEVRITPSELLRRAGLNATSFANWSSLRAHLNSCLERDLQQKLGYRPNLDIREPPLWPNEKPILVIAGESGSGKTWQAAAAAKRLSTDSQLVLIVRATGKASEDLAQAAKIVVEALDREAPLDLQHAARRLHDVVPGFSSPWLTVLVDDVQTMAEARQLVDADLRSFGCQLMFTAPHPIGQAIHRQFSDLVHLVEVQDFTPRFVRKYLELRGRVSRELPEDVLDLLKRPILASVYCETGLDHEWTPANEYALCERFWKRIWLERSQPDHPHDLHAIRCLANGLLSPDARYPWSVSDVVDSGIDEQAQLRLEQIGWLRRLPDDLVEISHDRLLNWAVAETLVHQRRTDRVTVDQFVKSLADLFERGGMHAGKNLSYVLMDALWLLCDPTRPLYQDVGQLLQAIEQVRRGWLMPELYEQSFPTLGNRFLPALRLQLEASAEREYNPYIELTANLLILLRQRHPVEVATWAIEGLSDDLAIVQETSLMVLANFPAADQLDRIWELHQTAARALDAPSEARPIRRYQSGFAAMKASTSQRPDWLIQRIHVAQPQRESLSELAYLVAALEGPAAENVWKATKAALFAKMPAEKTRSLIRCIARFVDLDEVPALERWIDDTAPLAAETAIGALAHIAPALALDHLGKLSWQKLYFSRGWWLPRLLLTHPDETRKRICDLLQSADSVWEKARVYQSHEHEIDSATVEVLLERLEPLVDEALRDPPRVAPNPLWFPLELLSKITRWDALDVMATKVGSPIEDKLAKLAVEWSDNDALRDEFKRARLILLKMGGDQLGKVINSQLQGKNPRSLFDALQWATRCPTSVDLQRIRDISQSDELIGEPAKGPFLQIDATRVLAIHGDNQGVVDSILRWGRDVSPDVAELRAHQKPMSDQELTAALRALDESDANVRANGVLALGASGRTDYTPQIRQILASEIPSSSVALAAILALEDLGENQPEVVPLLRAQLGVGPNRWAAALALLHLGTPEAIDELDKHFAQRANAPLDDVDQLIALNLSAMPGKRRRAAEILWNDWLQEPPLVQIHPAPYLERFGPLDAEDVREVLLDRAFGKHSDGSSASARVAAIRSLLSCDPEEGLSAATTALSESCPGSETLPAAILKAIPEQGLDALVRTIDRGLSTLIRWSIGAAMRLHSQADVVSDRLETMFASTDHRTRIAAADLAAWRGTSFNDQRLKHLYVRDPSERVRIACQEALCFRDQEKQLLRLIGKFEDATDSRRWVLLESVLDIGVPLLLGMAGQALREALSGLPSVFWFRYDSAFKQFAELLQKEAKTLDDSRHG